MSDSNNIPIRFTISTTDDSAKLGVRVSLDGSVVYENVHVTETYDFSHSVKDDDGDHELVIEMFGKQQTHTKIDEHGNILKDAMLKIDYVEFDDIDVSDLLTKIAEYHHDFNGSQAPTVAKFYKNLGCNGAVKVKFSTPLYIWLLENM